MRCYLVKCGVPFEKVFSVDELMTHEKLAMYVTFAEMDGNRFNWSQMRFEERKAA